MIGPTFHIGEGGVEGGTGIAGFETNVRSEAIRKRAQNQLKARNAGRRVEPLEPAYNRA